jgi:hypothetical protein
LVIICCLCEGVMVVICGMCENGMVIIYCWSRGEWDDTTGVC